MSNNYNSINRISERIDKRKRSEFLQKYLSPKKLIDNVLKIHQQTTWHLSNRFNYTDPHLYSWLELVSMKDSVPSFSEETITLGRTDFYDENLESVREFKKNSHIGIDILSKVLYNSFGRERNTLKKKYPSAGGLYPIIPVLFVLDNSAVELNFAGSYIYNSTENELLLIKKFEQKDIKKLKEYISTTGLENPNIAIAYAIDIMRSITKYRVRGYRHALIEVGLMAQNFRHSIWGIKEKKLGECCWSGFSDNATTHILGLSPRLAPIALIQWFGEKSDI